MERFSGPATSTGKLFLAYLVSSLPLLFQVGYACYDAAQPPRAGIALMSAATFVFAYGIPIISLFSLPSWLAYYHLPRARTHAGHRAWLLTGAVLPAGFICMAVGSMVWEFWRQPHAVEINGPMLVLAVSL